MTRLSFPFLVRVTAVVTNIFCYNLGDEVGQRICARAPTLTDGIAFLSLISHADVARNRVSLS